MNLRKFALVLAAGMLVVAPQAVFAATTDNVQTTVTVVEPALDIDLEAGPLSFGTSRTSDATYDSDGLTVTVTDSATDTQTTTGWNVTAQASALTSGANSISADNVKFNKDGVMTVTDTGGAQTQNASPIINGALAASVNLDAAQKLVTSSAVNQSKGSFQLAFANDSFKLFVPGATPAGTYTGTLTMTISRGL